MYAIELHPSWTPSCRKKTFNWEPRSNTMPQNLSIKYHNSCKIMNIEYCIWNQHSTCFKNMYVILSVEIVHLLNNFDFWQKK